MNHNPAELDKIFEAIANAKRRAIIYDLSLSPATVKMMADKYNLTLPAIHKHMAVLETSGIVIKKKFGRTNFVALNPKKLRPAQAWINQYKTGWGSAQASLENYIAGMRE